MVEMAMFNVQKSNHSKTRQSRVTVNVFCMLSHSALHLCKVWVKISWMVSKLWSGHQRQKR